MHLRLTRNQIFLLGASTGIIATALILRRPVPLKLWATPEQILAITEDLGQAIHWDTPRGLVQVRVLSPV